MRLFVSVTTALLLLTCGVFAARGQDPYGVSQDPTAKQPQAFERNRPQANEAVPVADHEGARSTIEASANREISSDAGPTGMPPTPTPKYVASQEVVVSWSEKGDAIWGFSKNTGQWTRQEIQPAAEDELAPVVGGSVAGLQVGGAIYAYSGQTGRWDVLRLPESRKPQVSVDIDMVLVMDEQGIYTFADSTGRWSARDAAATGAAEDRRPAGQLSIMYLVHADAQSVSAIVSRLFPHVAVVADQRLNAIIVSGSPEDVSKLEAVAKKIDQPHPDRPARYQSYPAAREGAQADAQPQTPALREKYNQLEQQAARLAGQYRDLPMKAARTPSDAEALKEQLAGVVQEAFEARQELQRAELDELRRRLGRIEEQIAARQRIKEAIVARRVEELLNPVLRWEPDAQAPSISPGLPGGQAQAPSISPIVPTVTQVQISLTVFDATEQASKELGLPAFQHPGSWRPMPDLFRKKLQDMINEGEATLVAEPTLVTTLGRAASFALREPSLPLETKVTPGESDGLDVVIAGLELLGGADAVAFPTRYGQPTVVGPFVCQTEGRRTFVCLRATPVQPPPPPPILPETLPALQTIQPGGSRAWAAAGPSPLILRSAEEFGRSLNEAEVGLKRLTELKEGGRAAAATVESARRNLAILREEYAAQIRLLELELEEAENAREAAARNYEDFQRLHKAKAASDSELGEAFRAVRTADLRVERVQTLLELYRKVGETDSLEPPPPAYEAKPAR